MGLPGGGTQGRRRGPGAAARGPWLALIVLVSVPSGARAAGVELGRDSLLAGLVREALADRPELIGARATAQAEAARVPQARALPDPVVSLGVQNDGFQRLQLGRMETSYGSVAAAQTFPWYGKRSLRARAQALAAEQSEADLDRARLGVQAEVERAYLDLLEVRDQLRILDRLQGLWQQFEGLSRSRYETGEAAQSDLLRARLERSRLQQQRWALLAEERRRLAVLDRAAGRPLEQPLASALSLADLADPVLPDSVAAEVELERRSPELRRARLATEQSSTRVSLARRDYFPDLTVSGGVMPRGGGFAPMWQAGVSLSLPLWAGGRQSRAVSEARLRRQAAESAAEAVRRLARLRLEERRALLSALLETNRLYRAGVLIQSEAAVASTVAQYRVGRESFAAVLEAVRGFYSDQLGYLGAVAAAQRIGIAQRELSLDPVGGVELGALGGGSLPGGDGTGAGLASSGGDASPPPAAASNSSSAMPGM